MVQVRGFPCSLVMRFLRCHPYAEFECRVECRKDLSVVLALLILDHNIKKEGNMGAVVVVVGAAAVQLDIAAPGA